MRLGSLFVAPGRSLCQLCRPIQLCRPSRRVGASDAACPSRLVNPLKIALKAVVPPHAPPIVKEDDNETLFDENVMVARVPAGER